MGSYVCKSLTRKLSKKKQKTISAVNNTVNKLILDRGSCEKSNKKVRFPDPIFITSGIYVYYNNVILVY